MGVRDSTIQSAPLGDGGVNGSLDLCFVANIAAKKLCVGTLLSQRPCGPFATRHVDVDEQHT
tara:strand:+ start:708 stop:893 length:186 start_codon:yes stop_codon:yes gene_type:complete